MSPAALLGRVLILARLPAALGGDAGRQARSRHLSGMIAPVKLSATIVVVAFLGCVAGAAADEGPTLLAGDSAVVLGTRIACLATATSVRCGKAGGLTATLSREGVVSVTRRGVPVAPGGRHTRLRLGINGGFFVATTPIYCHVYVQGSRVMTCSVATAKGGIPKSRGFDISDRSVVVFRYGVQDDRHPVRTYRMP
jgi:hypothetical protein